MQQELLNYFNSGIPSLGLYIFPLLIWSMFWKGTALWHASKMNSLPWFIAILVVNTFGLLEIGYLIWLKSKGIKIFG